MRQIGVEQVYKSLEMLGGAADGQYRGHVGVTEGMLPSASLSHIEKAEALAGTLTDLLSTSISRPACRAT